LGAVAGAVLPGGTGNQLAPSNIQLTFREIAAARGPAAKAVLVRKLLSEVSPLEAKYVVKIMTGDLRIGLKESLVEEAIAKAFGGSVKDVQRANILVGDIGETLRLAAEGRLEDAKMRLFHPIGFMLASPAESAEDALSYFQNAWVEDKYDGIRAQAHCSGETVRFFSRTRDEITESFPELPEALAGSPQDVILDGEIVAWSYAEENPNIEGLEVRAPTPVPVRQSHGRALPFSALQQRFGRKKVSEKLMREVPVAYLVFDVLYASGELVMDRPLRERAGILDELLKAFNHREHGGTQRKTTQRKIGAKQSQLAFDGESNISIAQVIRAPVFQASSTDAFNTIFDPSPAREN
jgi:DNA ligase-1